MQTVCPALLAVGVATFLVVFVQLMVRPWRDWITDQRLRGAIWLFCALGLIVSGYLLERHLGHKPIACTEGHGCDAVMRDPWSKPLGIPLPFIGIAGWLAIGGSMFLQGEKGRALPAIFTIIGVAYSAILTYRESHIDEWCQWCVANAIFMVFACVFATWRYLTYAPRFELSSEVSPAQTD